MKKILVAAGVWQLLRMGRRRRTTMRRQRRNQVTVSVLALVAGGAAAYYVVSRRRGEDQPQWPSRKKLERDARQAEGRLRAQQGNERPPTVRVQQNAGTDLKVPLGDVTR
jgi:hypothetical protein